MLEDCGDLWVGEGNVFGKVEYWIFTVRTMSMDWECETVCLSSVTFQFP
jgi:hypothetical protein